MKKFPITWKNLYLFTVFLLAIPMVLLVTAAALIFFLFFGGGWAYKTAGRCEFELNAFEVLMLLCAGLGLTSFLWRAGRRLVRRYHPN